MKHQRQQRAEWMMLVGLFSSALAGLGWAILWPIPMPAPQSPPTRLPQAGVSATAELGTASSDQSAWSQELNQRRLQGWAITSEPVELVPLASPPTRSGPEGPLAGLVLTGTIIEPGRSFAMVSDRWGATDLKPVGGLLRLKPAGVRIDSIVDRRVVVSFEGLTHELDLVPSSATEPNLGAATGSQTAPSSLINGDSSGLAETGMQLDTSSVDPTSTELSPLEAELEWLNGSEPEASSDSSLPDSPHAPSMDSQMGVGS